MQNWDYRCFVIQPTLYVSSGGTVPSFIHLSACSVPAEQFSRGRWMRFTFGCSRKAIMSTPYWHAAELLDAGRWALVPFEEPAAIKDTAIELLDNGRGPPGNTRTCLRLCPAPDLEPGSAVLYVGLRPSSRQSHATCPRGVSAPSCREEGYQPTHKCLTLFQRSSADWEKDRLINNLCQCVDLGANRMSRGDGHRDAG